MQRGALHYTPQGLNMNYPITPLAAALFVALTTLAAGAAHAEKFPYRNLEIDKPPPLTAPEPGDVTFTPKPGAMVVASPASGASAAPAQSIVNTSKSNTKDRVMQDDAAAAEARKGWDGTVKGGSIQEGKVKGKITREQDTGLLEEETTAAEARVRQGGMVNGTVVINNARIVEPVGGGGCTGPDLGGKLKPGCPVPNLEHAPMDKGINQAGLPLARSINESGVSGPGNNPKPKTKAK
jgi:hypothetical protein